MDKVGVFFLYCIIKIDEPDFFLNSFEVIFGKIDFYAFSFAAAKFVTPPRSEPL